MSVDPKDPRMGFHPDSVHLLRTTMQAQYQLSQMADQKANMVLAASFVIFSVSISQAAAGARPLPLLVLGAAAFAAAALAMLAVLPSVKTPPAPDGPANILFFGNFANLSRDDYVSGMEWLMKQPEVLYRSMIQDLYGVGVVLQKKYRMLRISYLLFLLGVGLGVTLFVITFFIAAAQPDVSISDAYVSPLPSVPGLAMTPPDTAATVPADTMLVGPDAP